MTVGEVKIKFCLRIIISLSETSQHNSKMSNSKTHNCFNKTIEQKKTVDCYSVFNYIHEYILQFYKTYLLFVGDVSGLDF